MSEVKMPNRKGLNIVSKKGQKLEGGFEGLKGLSLQSEKERLKTKDQEQKRKEQKQAKKDEKLKQNAISNTTQTNENPPSQEKTKIKIISFLGLSRGENGAKARYNSDNFTLLDIKSGDYENATELLIDNYNDGLSDMQMKFFATQDAFNKQKDILQKCKIFDGDFDINHECFIKYNKTDYNELYKKLLDEIGNTSEKTHIIVDITHGFRDNTFLSILASLIQLNINKNRIIRFMVAKEIIQHKKYELISLDEYIENMVMSNVLSTFKQCLKVPDYNLDNPLYLALKGFSDALFKNQIQDINKNLKNLFYYERNPIQSLANLQILIDEIMQELKELNSVNIKSAGNGKIKPKRAFYYELAVLYKKHDYFLNCVQFLLESIYLHIFNEFKQQLNRTENEYCYSEYQAIRDFLFSFEETKPNVNQNNHKYTKYKDLYPDDIKLFNSLINLAREIADLRHRMSHCDAFSDDY